MIQYALIIAIAIAGAFAVRGFWKERPLRKRVRHDVKEIANIVKECDHRFCYFRYIIRAYPFLMRQIRSDPDYETNYQRFREEAVRRSAHD